MKLKNKLGFLILSTVIMVMMLFPIVVLAADYSIDTTIPFKVMGVGEGYPDADRTNVVIEAKTDAPLPAKTEVQVIGLGEDSFGPIHYDAPGIYEYIVREKPGTANNVVYDGSVYDVSVIVTNSADGGLQSEIKAKTIKSDKKDPLVFKNTYKKPEKVEKPEKPYVKPKDKTGDTAGWNIYLYIIAGCLVILGVASGLKNRDEK